MTTEPIQHTDVTQVVQALKGSMLFTGLIIGIMLYILIHYMKSKQHNFIKFFFSKHTITAVLIILLSGSALITSWIIDQSSLDWVFNLSKIKDVQLIDKLDFVTCVGYGIFGIGVLHQTFKKVWK